MNERRAWQNLHMPLLGLTLALMLGGLVNLFSASHAGEAPYFHQQLIWSGIALAVGALCVLVDYRVHERLAYPYFIIALGLLALVFLFPASKGSQRWIDLGPMRLQPSELAKLAVVFALARWFHDDANSVPYKLRQLGAPLFMLGAAALLVLKEPDLGTTLLLLAIGATLILFARVKASSAALVLLVGLIAVPPAWTYVLKDYQKQRVLNLLNPEADIQGAGWHRQQSVIAIGSGGVAGKGFGGGTQTQLQFLPERHTDFIFAVWAEEHGFIGAAALLAAYLALFLFGLQVADQARERFGALVAVGCTAILFWQTVVNVGMVLGVLPVVGMTLPFLSYGGTSLVVSAACVGLLLNIGMRRTMF